MRQIRSSPYIFEDEGAACATSEGEYAQESSEHEFKGGAFAQGKPVHVDAQLLLPQAYHGIVKHAPQLRGRPVVRQKADPVQARRDFALRKIVEDAGVALDSLRKILPKGTSFEGLDAATLTEICCELYRLFGHESQADSVKHG